MKCVLAYDIGTSGTKAALFTTEGELLARATVSYETYYPRQGWAEQDPTDWWQAVVACTRSILRQGRKDGKHVKCISFSGMGGAIVPVDKRGRQLKATSPVWFDTRGSAQSERILSNIDSYDLYKIRGGLRNDLSASCKLMWLRENEPELFRQTHKFLGAKEFIVLKMTGNMLTDYSGGGSFGLLDLRKRDYSPVLLRITKIPREKLLDLHESTFVGGELGKTAAQQLGLMQSTPVALGGNDVPCTSLGAGCFTDGQIYTYIGTSAWIALSSRVPLFGDREVRPVPFVHVIPDMYTTQVSLYSAGGSYEWLHGILFGRMTKPDESLAASCFRTMDEEAKEAPIGSNGVLFLPNMVGGANISPNPNIRGAFVGLSPSNRRGDLIRAALEGVCLELGACLDVLRDMSVTVNDMAVVGGGSKSSLWRQVLADVFNTRVVLRDIGQQVAVLGAAIVGGISVGMWKDFSIVNELSHVVDTCLPDVGNHMKYLRLLELYKFASDRNEEICDRIVTAKL